VEGDKGRFEDEHTLSDHSGGFSITLLAQVLFELGQQAATMCLQRPSHS
jgi:hypothetical protein